MVRLASHCRSRVASRSPSLQSHKLLCHGNRGSSCVKLRRQQTTDSSSAERLRFTSCCCANFNHPDNDTLTLIQHTQNSRDSEWELATRTGLLRSSSLQTCAVSTPGSANGQCRAVESSSAAAAVLLFLLTSSCHELDYELRLIKDYRLLSLPGLRWCISPTRQHCNKSKTQGSSKGRRPRQRPPARKRQCETQPPHRTTT